MKKLLLLLMFTSLLLCFSGCNTEDAECNNPEVTAFVKQLKAGTYNTKNELGIVVLPPFTFEDIPDLLKHAENLAVIPSFPTMYNSNSGKTRLGECLLWLIESIRLGMPTSMGCNMVKANAISYDAVYFLSDYEVLDAVARYRSWWENRRFPRTVWSIEPCYDDPLCGSGYRWW